MEENEKQEYILSLSYGKDSIACLGAIKQLGWKLDRIVTAEVMATETISADLPPMIEFKKKVDKKIYEQFGIKVEHVYAKSKGEINWYEKQFYTQRKNKTFNKITIYGFPCQRFPWCNNKLKVSALTEAAKICKNAIQYVGIAADEPKRFHTLTDKIISPLKEAGWTEADCKQWCIDNDMLSPIYETSERGGCWFCQSQGINQLRLLRHNYNDYWQLLLKWDKDSPVPFRVDGHTIHDLDKRFEIEESGLLEGKPWRWKYLDVSQINTKKT